MCWRQSCWKADGAGEKGIVGDIVVFQAFADVHILSEVAKDYGVAARLLVKAGLNHIDLGFIERS